MSKTSTKATAKQPPTLTYSHVVVVTLAKPATAPHMLELAVSLADPEDGRVIALTVTEGEGEETEQRIKDLQPVVDRFAEEGHPVELVTQIAGTVARGILDGAREHQAETLIIGVQQAGRRQVKLGSLVENIVAAAPCNVLIYRPSESPEYDSVVVPIDSSQESLISLRFGAALAAKKQIPVLPLYIQRDYTYRPEHEEQVRKILEPLPDDLVRKDMISGRDPAERILRDRDEDDLLIVGFSQKSNLELEFGRDLASVLLNRAPGPVLLSSQILRERDTFLGAVQRWLQRFDPALTQTERNEIVWGSRRSALNNIDYSVLIMMSAALASLGLLLNSAAVIIGAMLVAPLMSPLGALATGMATGLIGITRRAALTLLQGVMLALLISIFMGVVLPTDTPTAEMLVRGNPSLLDAAVALFSGLVAAFAIARKEIPAALAGVAIAAALMPPVCTIGLGIAFRNWSLAGGATLLFITNIVFIVVAENIVFLWMGFRPGRQPESERGVVFWWGIIVILLVAVVSLLVTLGQQASIDSRVEQILRGALPESAAIMDVVVEEVDEGLLHVMLDVRSSGVITPAEVAEYEAALQTTLERPVQLEVAALPVVTPLDTLERHVIEFLEREFTLWQVINVDVQDEDAQADITITVQAQTVPDTSVVTEAEEALEELLERPVRLTLVLQQVIVPPEATPERTPEATAEVE